MQNFNLESFRKTGQESRYIEYWKEKEAIRQEKQFETHRIKLTVSKGIFDPDPLFTHSASMALDYLCHNSKGNILEIGGGCGILSIAAKKFGARKVVSTEIDNSAIENFKSNVHLNNLSGIDIIKTSQIPKLNVKYDLILANIIFAEPVADETHVKSSARKTLNIHNHLLLNCRRILKARGRVVFIFGSIGDIDLFSKILANFQNDYKIKFERQRAFDVFWYLVELSIINKPNA